MGSHRLKSVQLTQFYLHRIKKLNPTLRAVITVSPTALAEARAADKARRNGDDRPLLGIPIGLAFDFEQATEVRVPPRFIPTIGDDLFPGVPNPPDQVQAQRKQATHGQRDLGVRFR